MNANQALESFINGNLSIVREWLKNATISLGEFLEIYIHEYSPSDEEIVFFVKSLEA